MKHLNQITNDEIKFHLSITAVLQHYGGQIVNKTSGSWWCPIHEAGGKGKGHKTPSLIAKDERGSATCMSQACFESDDIFGVIGKMEHLDIKNDFPTIKEKACNMAGIIYETKKEESLAKKTVQHPIEPLKDAHIQYLQSIGVNEQTAQLFQLKSRYDYILYPQIQNGKTIGYKGISTIINEETGKKKFFIEDKKCSLWFEPLLKKEKHIVFVEGEKDCMRLTQAINEANKQNELIVTTVTTGARTIPPDITCIMQKLKPHTVSIFYDNGTAGREGSENLAIALTDVDVLENIDVYFFPKTYKEEYDISDWFDEGKNLNDLFLIEKKSLSKNSLALADSPFFQDPTIFFGLQDLQPPPPPIQWLIEGFLAQGKVGAIVATGSTGKSWFLLQLAIAIASGNSFMNMRNPSEGGEVLYILGEEEKDDIHRRTTAIKEVYKEQNSLENEKIAHKNLSFLCVNGKNVALNNESRLFADLKTYIKIKAPKLIIFDPAIRFFDGDENNSNDATRFIEILEALKNLGSTIIFAHHTSKPLADTLDQHSARGSSAFIDGARWNLVLKKINKKNVGKYKFENDKSYLDPELCERYINAEIVKCNGFKPIENEFTFKRSKNGVLIRSPKLILDL